MAKSGSCARTVTQESQVSEVKRTSRHFESGLSKSWRSNCKGNQYFVTVGLSGFLLLAQKDMPNATPPSTKTRRMVAAIGKIF